MYALVYGAREGKNDFHNILAGELHSKLSRGLVKHSIKENSVSVLYIGTKEHFCKEQLINVDFVFIFDLNSCLFRYTLTFQHGHYCNSYMHVNVSTLSNTTC